MAFRSIKDQIAANKRGSVLFLFMLILLLAGLGAGIAGVYKPHLWPIFSGGAAALGIILGLLARLSGPDIMLSVAGAREATHQEDQMLDNVVEEMAIAGGLPKPRIFVADDPSPNAFATGMNPNNSVICVTTGLLQKLNRDELQGVVAHEMSHIRNYDVQFMTTVAIVAGLIPMLADFLRMSMWYGGGRRSSDDEDSGGGVLVLIGFILSILAPIFAVFLQLAISRKREFLADASAADLTRYPEGLASALIKISNDGEPLLNQNRTMQGMYIANPLESIDGSALMSTHPSTQSRVEALMAMSGQYAAMRAQTPQPRLAAPMQIDDGAN